MSHCQKTLWSKVRLFGQWVANNNDMPPTANAGQYSTLKCKPLLFSSWLKNLF